MTNSSTILIVRVHTGDSGGQTLPSRSAPVA